MNRRRKFQGYRVKKGRAADGKYILITVVVVAIASALVFGVALGKKAELNKYGQYERQNLIDFGGVETAEADYESNPSVVGKFVAMGGLDKGSFRSAIRGYMQSSAIVYDVNDGLDGVYFKTAITGVNSLTELTVKEISDVLEGEDRYAIACFNVGSLNSERPVEKLSVELSVITEAVSYGVNELMIFGLPSTVTEGEYVTAYLSFVSASSTGTAITVVLSRDDVSTAGASRLISAAKPYADGFAIDMRTVNNGDLPSFIKKCAYYITNYNARVIVNDAEGEEREEIEAILASFGIENYIFKK